MILLQCGKAWKTSPVTRHHPPALWRINKWQTIWMSSIADLKKTPFTPPATPLSPHTYTADKWGRRAPGLQKEQKKESTRPRWCVTNLPKNLCWLAGPPSSHRSSTDHWSCAKSPHASNAPPSSPSQRNPKLMDFMYLSVLVLYLSRVSKRAGKITLDPSHPAHSLFALLPSGRRYRALSTRTTRHRNSFFPQAIHLMNTWH